MHQQLINPSILAHQQEGRKNLSHCDAAHHDNVTAVTTDVMVVWQLQGDIRYSTTI
jgi:hypothetical protein